MSAFCYFGIYRPTWARDLVLLRGLKELGAPVLAVTDQTPGWRKYWNLARAYRRLNTPHGYVLVGYLSNVLVPLGRLLAHRPVIFNAGNAMYEGAVLDRQNYPVWSPRRYLIWLIDFAAFHSAHCTLVESAAQKKFIHQHFFVPERKLRVLFTGADEQVFYPDPAGKSSAIFTLVFRGALLPATGVGVVLEAARLLQNEPINFLLIGRGPELAAVKKTIQEFNLSKVELVTSFLTPALLRQRMLAAHAMLGQFAAHPRLERTIQNKTFEALALGLPYITRDSASNRELLTDGENCLFVPPADPAALAAKILALKNNPALAQKLSQNGLALYRQSLTPRAIAERFLLGHHINTRAEAPNSG